MLMEQDCLNQSYNPSFNPAVTPLCQGGLTYSTEVAFTYTRYMLLNSCLVSQWEALEL